MNVSSNSVSGILIIWFDFELGKSWLTRVEDPTEIGEFDKQLLTVLYVCGAEKDADLGKTSAQ